MFSKSGRSHRRIQGWGAPRAVSLFSALKASSKEVLATSPFRLIGVGESRCSRRFRLQLGAPFAWPGFALAMRAIPGKRQLSLSPGILLWAEVPRKELINAEFQTAAEFKRSRRRQMSRFDAGEETSAACCFLDRLLEDQFL